MERVLTRKLPRLVSMQIHLHQCSLRDPLITHLLVEIVANKLLITWVEPEPWWQCGLYVPQSHLYLSMYC